MFVPRKLGYRPWPISITLQDLDTNNEIVEETHTFIGHFRLFTEDEYKTLVDEINGVVPPVEGAEPPVEGAEPPPEVKPPENLVLAAVLKRNAQLFGNLMIGWSEVRTKQGQEIEFSPETLTGLVTGHDGFAVSAGISLALTEIRFGRAGVKNSQTSAKPGPGLAEGAPATSSPTT